MLQQPDVEQSLQENFDEDIFEEKSISVIAKPSSPILKDDRQIIISEIVECLKNTSKNVEPLKRVLKMQSRSVSFNSIVNVYPYIPVYIFCKKKAAGVIKWWTNACA